MKNGRLAVLSDIHGNADALAAAVAQLRECARLEHVIVLGDLLTYGAKPLETLALVESIRATWPTTFIRGNHDILYATPTSERQAYYERLPDWIRGSVDDTRDRLSGVDLEEVFTWEDEVVLAGVLLSHANPFGAGDWTYLRAAEDFERARHVLVERGLRGGVFGHTHRGKLYADTLDAWTQDGALLDARGRPVDAWPWVLTVGALGQPREPAGSASWVFVELVDGQWTLERRNVEYDVDAHCAAIRALPLPERIRDRLLSFHGAAGGPARTSR